MAGSAFTDMELRRRRAFIYLFPESGLVHSFTAQGERCADAGKACLPEHMLGLLPTHDAWAMANLIPIDFYAEGKPNTIYP